MSIWRPWEPLKLPPYVQVLREQALLARLRYEYERELYEAEQADTVPVLAAIDPRCEWLTRAERNRLAFLRWLIDHGKLSEYDSSVR